MLSLCFLAAGFFGWFGELTCAMIGQWSTVDNYNNYKSFVVLHYFKLYEQVIDSLLLFTVKPSQVYPSRLH